MAQHTIFSNIKPRALSTDLEHSDDEDAIDDLEMEPGECRRVDGLPNGRVYHLRVGNLFLQITDHGINKASPAGMHYNQSYGSTEKVDPGEAFAFLHGDYSPTHTHACLGCGTEFTQPENGCDRCPVGTQIVSTEWPDVPTRSPRLLIDGKLLCRPPEQ